MANWLYNLLHGKMPGKGFLGRSSTGSGPAELLDPTAARSLLGVGVGVSPSFSVHRNEVDQTITPNTPVKINWTTEEFDTNNNFDLTNDRFQPTAPGKYLFVLSLHCPDNTTWCQARLYKNGLEVIEAGNKSSLQHLISVSRIIDMNGTTDYVEAYVYNGGGTTLSGDKKLTSFTGSRIDGGSGLWTHNSPDISYTAGDVGIGQTTPAARTHIKGSSSDSSAYISKKEDSSGNIVSSTRCDGLKTHTGAIARPPLTITADMTLTTATQAFLLLNFSATGGVVTFPSAPEHGQEFHPENIGSFSVTLARNGKLMNGSASNVSLSSQNNGFFKYDSPSGSWWNFN